MNEQLFVLTNQKKKTSHVLHLLLCIPTFGLWLIPWGIIASINSSHNGRINSKINNIMYYKAQGLSDTEIFNQLRFDAHARAVRNGRIFIGSIIAIIITIILLALLKN